MMAKIAALIPPGNKTLFTTTPIVCIIEMGQPKWALGVCVRSFCAKLIITIILYWLQIFPENSIWKPNQVYIHPTYLSDPGKSVHLARNPQADPEIRQDHRDLPGRDIAPIHVADRDLIPAADILMMIMMIHLLFLVQNQMKVAVFGLGEN